MDKIFVRNYVFFVLALLLCAGCLINILISGNKTINRTDDWIAHTNEIIVEVEKVSGAVESMLAAQRGYIITGKDEFLKQYKMNKQELDDRLAYVAGLVGDNAVQKERLRQIREHFAAFSIKLDERAIKYKSTADQTDSFVADIESVNKLKDEITKLNTAMLRAEHDLLNQRLRRLEVQKSNYFTSLLVGIVIASALLLLLNGFLLLAQRRRSHVEASLKDTQERFALAVEGTQDGIFDWNIKTGEVFYSRQFFSMLGYDRESFTGTTKEFQDILHPEDSDKVWEYAEQYLNRTISEYAQEFRLKNSAGRWVWIQSRAKATWDSKGKPIRLIGAHTDISTVKEREARLEAAKTLAEDANLAKSDFLAHMSHEIRTPLTAISGIAEIFQKNKDNLNEKQQRLVDTLSSSTSILKDLVNDVLDFSKIESGELELAEESCSLSRIFQEVISMMTVRANEKAISFVFDYQSLRDVDFICDKMRLRQIMTNLIGNAIKFTKEGGVTIHASREDRAGHSYLRLDVQDTGPGIATENFDLIFERFKQADSSVSRKYGGTGLGLPISKSLAKLMGGTILLESTLGKGSTFTLMLPFRAAKKSENESTDFSDVEQRLNERITASLTEHSKILVVEDYEGNIIVLCHILEELGCAYDVARTGREAIDFWKKKHYDIVLMDIQMPEMDGFAATTAIRQLEASQNLPRTPIVGMTAHALVGDKDKCIAAGMDAYLPKPIVEVDLKRQILKYLNTRKKAA